MKFRYVFGRARHSVRAVQAIHTQLRRARSDAPYRGCLGLNRRDVTRLLCHRTSSVIAGNFTACFDAKVAAQPRKFHIAHETTTTCSRQRKEADPGEAKPNPPPYICGYVDYEICELTPSELVRHGKSSKQNGFVATFCGRFRGE